MHLKGASIAHDRFPVADAYPFNLPITAFTTYERTRHYRIYREFFGHDV